ncbi:MAG: Gfo/Idh/MocA family oxidoreductase [Clostridia bacterium]|nr:Gfo/Idh/MocA family oxidoreductase [Clostridia bacterium]
MKPIKMGIFGFGRGGYFCDNILWNNGEVVAVCENNPERIERAKKKLGENFPIFTDFDEFLKQDMDAVFICNHFHNHASYAIKCLEKGIHVLSETTSNGTMAEGVALVRAAEKSKAIYMLAENYPYMKFNQEIYKVYRTGKLGKALFCEGEYNHPIDWTDDKTTLELIPCETHWRLYLPATYYLTHALAPLMRFTGAFPKRVTVFPVFSPENKPGFSGDRAAIITTLNDDDSVFRVMGWAGFGAEENSYRICATKGQIENVRGTNGKIMLRYNPWETPEGEESEQFYSPEWAAEDQAAENAGHGGGDFFLMREFFKCIRAGKPNEFDVYFATTMASVAILGHRSLMENGMPYDIPDFRKEEDRKKYENDTLTPFYGVDGTPPIVPCCSRPDYQPPKDVMEHYKKILAEYQAKYKI